MPEKGLTHKPKDLSSDPSSHVKAMFCTVYLYRKAKEQRGADPEGSLDSCLAQTFRHAFETLAQNLRCISTQFQ